MEIDLDPRTDYRVKKGRRKERFWGPGWPALAVVLLIFVLMFSLTFVPEGSWLSPVARVLVGQYIR